MNVPPVVQKGSSERNQKAAQLRLFRLAKRFLSMADSIRTEKPEMFARLICDGVLGNPFPGTDLTPFALRGGLKGSARTFRYLAKLIIARLDGTIPDTTGPYISLATWIEANASFELRSFADNPYSVNFRNLTGTVGQHDLYVSHVQWAFFDDVAEALNYSAMLAARMLYRGIRLFEQDAQTGDIRPVAWGDDDYIFLRQKGKREEVTTGYLLPDWAARYFVSTEHVKLHDALFRLDYDLSAEEIEYRRSVLIPQCIPPESMARASWPWGDHETELLRKLSVAAREWWSTYDPETPSTAPTNDEVRDWLAVQGVARRVAEVMAQILRADGLAAGPRK